MDGFETCTQIRQMVVQHNSQHEHQIESPIIVAVTAQEDIEVNPKYPSSGFDGVINKPVQLDHLEDYLLT
jgi:CheY-like chemotaxis protein